VFDAVHETLCPDEFRRQQAQPKKNHQPSWSRSDQHYDTNQQKREAAYDARDAADLLDGAKEHEAFWKDPPEEKEEWSPVSSALILDFRFAARKGGGMCVCPTLDGYYVNFNPSHKSELRKYTILQGLKPPFRAVIGTAEAVPS
jgi:hypothetical protein